jgi:hypothetical protein
VVDYKRFEIKVGAVIVLIGSIHSVTINAYITKSNKSKNNDKRKMYLLIVQ